MKRMTLFEFVIDGMRRHELKHGRPALRLEMAPCAAMDMLSDVRVRSMVICGPDFQTIFNGVPLLRVTGVVPRFVRFDGAVEEI